MSVRDPGLQRERTQLAWVRTAIAFAVTADLVVRSGVLMRSTLLTVCGVMVWVTSVAVLAAGMHLGRLLGTDRPSAPHATLMRLVSAASLLAAGCGLWAFGIG